MRRGISSAILLLLMLLLTAPSSPQIDVFECDCDAEVDGVRLCWCAAEGVPIGTNCEYFYWTQYDGVDYLWHMCDGYRLFVPEVWR